MKVKKLLYFKWQKCWAQPIFIRLVWVVRSYLLPPDKSVVPKNKECGATVGRLLRCAPIGDVLRGRRQADAGLCTQLAFHMPRVV